MPSGYIQLIVGSHPKFEDGDILSACNHLTIRRLAAWRICGKRVQGRHFANLNRHGFIPTTHILLDWCENIYDYKLERLSRNEARMTRLKDSQSFNITTGQFHTDFAGRQAKMNVQEFFTRRIKTFQADGGNGLPVFSDNGQVNTVTLYLRPRPGTAAQLDSVWAAIAAKTPTTEAAETTYEKEPPFGAYKRKRAVLRVDDFTDIERGDLAGPLQDETDPDNIIDVKKRKHYMDWRSDLGLSGKDITDVLDDSKDPDLRTTEHQRSSVVKQKAI